MIRTSALVLLLLSAASSCRSGPDVVAADPGVREPLLGAVKALEGRWEGATADGTKELVHEFRVTSEGSAVRELMFPGTDHEMTNMYTLEGNALAMTHYCAGGNQPRMRAEGLEEGRIAFRFAGVSDLKASDEAYMGEMTLVLLDEDRIEEHWKAFRAGELDHEMVFELQRVR